MGRVVDLQHSDNSFHQFSPLPSVMPSSVLALGGESKSHGTSSLSLLLQILLISNIVPGRAPSWPHPQYNKGKEAGRQREEDGEGGEEGKQERERETEREHVMVKCFEVLNSAAAAPANHTIAAVVAATATAVANTHFKNVCIKLWTKSTPWNFHWIHSLKIFFFCWKQNQEYIHNFFPINTSLFCYYFIQ